MSRYFLDVEHVHQGKANPSFIYFTTFRAEACREEVRQRIEQGKAIDQLQGLERDERLRREEERQDMWKAAFEHLSAAKQRARKAKDVASRH